MPTRQIKEKKNSRGHHQIHRLGTDRWPRLDANSKIPFGSCILHEPKITEWAWEAYVWQMAGACIWNGQLWCCSSAKAFSYFSGYKNFIYLSTSSELFRIIITPALQDSNVEASRPFWGGQGCTKWQVVSWSVKRGIWGSGWCEIESMAGKGRFSTWQTWGNRRLPWQSNYPGSDGIKWFLPGAFVLFWDVALKMTRRWAYSAILMGVQTVLLGVANILLWKSRAKMPIAAFDIQFIK